MQDGNTKATRCVLVLDVRELREFKERINRLSIEDRGPCRASGMRCPLRAARIDGRHRNDHDVPPSQADHLSVILGSA